MKNKLSFSNNSALVTFLIGELLGLVAFGFTGNSLIFLVIGILLFLLFLAFNKVDLNKKKITNFALLYIPFLLFLILVSFGGLRNSSNIGVINRLFLIIGLSSFFLLGYFSSNSEGFKLSHVLLAIGGGIALVVLLSTFATWYNYGLFYVTKYSSTPIYYYNGTLFNVTKEATILVGFKFLTIKIETVALYSTLLSLSLAGLPFINMKEKKTEFIILLSLGIVGLISLISMPYIPGLLYSFIGIVFAFIYKLLKDKVVVNKVFDKVILVAIILAIILFAFIFINASRSSVICDYVENSTFLNKLFNTNQYIKPINEIFYEASRELSFFGFKVGTTGITDAAILLDTHSAELEIVKEGGIIALVLFVFFVLNIYMNTKQFMKKSNHDEYAKVIVVTMLLVFGLYVTFNWTSFQDIHNSKNYNSFIESNLFMIIVFLCGVVSNIPLNKAKKETIKVETKPEIKVEEVNL